MRRINTAMRRAIDLANLPHWVYRVSEDDAKELAKKDQREERK